MTTLDTLQQQVSDWQTHRWPDEEHPVVMKALKLNEEAGEVAGAVIKHPEGRATLQDILDEVADVQIVLCGLAASLGVDLLEITLDRWAEVRTR